MNWADIVGLGVFLVLLITGICEGQSGSDEAPVLSGWERKRALVMLSDLHHVLVEYGQAIEGMSFFLGQQHLLKRANVLQTSCETMMCCKCLTQGACDRLMAEVEVFRADADVAIAKQKAIPQDLNGGLYERF
ncbi:MAG: hypothetical protein QG668_193 [Patescibacteria group bacterium]|nr:hypothetical protein [Patescibacteria group bacterium]